MERLVVQHVSEDRAEAGCSLILTLDFLSSMCIVHRGIGAQG